MSMLGKAALAMWWDIEASMRAEFEHWHSHEHFPERLGVPGFLRASRWRGEGEGLFVLYEIESHQVLASAPYLVRLNAPTPWSTRLMPHHRHMVRAQCHVLESHGAVLARHIWTARLSPARDQEATLRSSLAVLIQSVAHEPGFSGAHLLRHQAPDIPTTTEQAIRGGDQEADWVFLVSGYEDDALRRWVGHHMTPEALTAIGAREVTAAGHYVLSATAVPAEVDKAAASAHT
jgi:quinol monooxygenase YgiN